MKKHETYGKIENGQIILFDSATWIEVLRNIYKCNHCKITLEYGNKRTLDQNAYAWAIFTKMAERMRQDGWDVDKDMIYRKVESTYCTVEQYNPDTGKAHEFVEPLKKQDTDRFAEIIDAVRMNFMQRYPDTYLKEPHEYYGITKEAYDKWKAGDITRTEAFEDKL